MKNQNTTTLSSIDTDFIHPKARFWVRIIWLTTILFAATCYASMTLSFTTAFDYGGEATAPDASQQSLEQSAAMASASTNAANPSKPEAAEAQPEQQLPARTVLVKVAKPKTSPTELMPEPEPKTPAPPAQQVVQTPPARPPSTFQIVEGKTAPYYTLESFEAIKSAARSVRGRFLVFDGSFSVEFGKTLSDGSNMRTVNSSWHQIYARRMIPVPMNQETRRAIQLAATTYPQLDTSTARVYLGVPHRVDQKILEAQRAFLGDRFDVRLTTEVRLGSSACKVTRIVEGLQ